MDNQNVLVTSKNLKEFPPEVLVAIFSWLPPKDIAVVSQTCRFFDELTKVDQLWAKLCLNYYNIQVPSAKGFAKKFCKNVLHSYGHLLGLWTKEDNHSSHGGLLHILYHDGQLLGYDLQVPKPSLNRTEPLRPKSLFRIYIDEGNNDEATIKCCLSQATSQLKIDLQYILKQGPAIDGSGQCRNLPKWYLVTSHTDGMSAWLFYQRDQYQRIDTLESENKVDKNDEHFDVVLADDGFVEDVNLRYHIIHPSHYSRLQFSRTPTFPVPTQAGMFTAITARISTTLGNLIKLSRQLVLISYDSQGDEEKVIGLFLTRDIKICPVGELIFKADLRHCITMDQENNPKIQVNWKDLSPQPFQVPPVFLEQFPDLPNVCLSKFKGYATIVNEFSDDVDLIPYGLMTEGQWIVFTENVLGFLVTHGQQPQMTIFHRVNQNPLLHQC